MADAYTTTAVSSLDQTAFDLAVYHALRPKLVYDTFADVRSTRQSFEGSAVQFTIVSDLSVATTALNQSTDLDAVAMADTTVSVTLAEYGNVVLYTKLLRSTAFVDFDPVAANVIGWNAADSLDTIARQRLQVGTNVRYSSRGTTLPTARNTIEPEDSLGAADVRRALADLTGSNVSAFGSYYVAVCHPDQIYDLRGQTGAAAWRDPHTYSQPGEIWTGETGEFEGFRFVQTAKSPLFADAGSSTTLTDVYAALFVGKQGLAKAHSHSDGNGPYPMVVPGPVTDKLRRNVPLGWYWLGDYGIFRQAAVRRVETSSSIGANT